MRDPGKPLHKVCVWLRSRSIMDLVRAGIWPHTELMRVMAILPAVQQLHQSLTFTARGNLATSKDLDVFKMIEDTNKHTGKVKRGNLKGWIRAWLREYSETLHIYARRETEGTVFIHLLFIVFLWCQHSSSEMVRFGSTMQEAVLVWVGVVAMQAGRRRQFCFHKHIAIQINLKGGHVTVVKASSLYFFGIPVTSYFPDTRKLVMRVIHRKTGTNW